MLTSPLPLRLPIAHRYNFSMLRESGEGGAQQEWPVRAILKGPTLAERGLRKVGLPQSPKAGERGSQAERGGRKGQVPWVA